MEEHLPMNCFRLFTLCTAIAIAGCASTLPEPLNTPSTSPASAAVDPVALAPHKIVPAATAQHPHAAVPSAGVSQTSEPLQPVDMQLTGTRVVAALAPPVDLWDRIRRGYAMPNLESDLVRDREAWYIARPDYILRMTERSRKYLFYIVEELELRNMPSELALLPFVESAFNPQAVSSAKAAGMWQFMPATGKHFELKQNAFRDDRRDVLASTRAALDYLQKLYGMFGDWHLALAAYNWGEGSVGKAIAKNRKAGLPEGYTDLNMPMETRFYVPKLQAIKNIVSAPDAFNAQLPVIGNHPYFQTVTIRRDIDVALAARLAEVDLDNFKSLNPSVNKPVILSAGTPQILLPWDNAEVFQRNLEGYTGGRLASWTVWVVPGTMHVAEAAKKAGMGEEEFRRINSIPPRMVIRPGSTLLVPRSARVEQDVTESVAENGQVSLAPEIVMVRSTIKAGKNDTVASIAHKYKTTAANVAQWNNISTGSHFKAGQKIVVMVPSTSLKSTRVAQSGAKPAHSSKKKRKG
jgi:membrane-bound lytic murein transglycosylase D